MNFGRGIPAPPGVFPPGAPPMMQFPGMPYPGFPPPPGAVPMPPGMHMPPGMPMPPGVPMPPPGVGMLHGVPAPPPLSYCKSSPFCYLVQSLLNSHSLLPQLSPQRPQPRHQLRKPPLLPCQAPLPRRLPLLDSRHLHFRFLPIHRWGLPAESNVLPPSLWERSQTSSRMSLSNASYR